jgi:hypothetical protein
VSLKLVAGGAPHHFCIDAQRRTVIAAAQLDVL